MDRKRREAGLTALIFVGVFMTVAVVYLGLLWLAEVRDIDALLGRGPAGSAP